MTVDDQEFYELCYAYRLAIAPTEVADRFDALKDAVRDMIADEEERTREYWSTRAEE